MLNTIFVDRYRIDGILGQGGMGIVYRAHDLLLDRDVAIKVLSKTALGTEGRARLLREAQSAAQLNHPNIVSIYDAGENETIPFIIMEFVQGRSLHEQPPTRLPDILDAAHQICLALEHAHSRNIIHRDLKPENVLITPGNQVKLMDFGLARSIASRLTEEGTLVGSVFYLAPELALGQAFDGRADLYALGVMLYEFVTGGLPFTAEDPVAIISQHLHAPVVPPRAHHEHLPPALDALIVQLLSKDPSDRPATAGEVASRLERLETGKTEATPESVPSLLDQIVRGRLIGRSEELGAAIEAWNQARQGENQSLLVSGEPGVGKTRLAREVVAHARVRGAYVLTGDCYADGSLPYAPVAQMIEIAASLYPLNGLAGLPDLISLAPGLRSRFPDLPSRPVLDPPAEQQRLYDSLVELVQVLSTRAPVLLLLEDAHWADSSTLALLRHLARRAARLKLHQMILMTYREVELDEARALNQILYDFTREKLGARIKLGRLDRDQTCGMLAALLAEEITPEFLESIYHETEGNPFFIEEVCKALVEKGDLYRAGGRWQWPPGETLEIPQSIKVAIQARIHQLRTPAQEVLRLASVIGREFDFETLHAVCELDEDSLIEALDSAVRAQLISEVRKPGKAGGAANPRFVFVHALIASTLRETISGLRRQKMHQRIALTLERLHPNQLDDLAQQLGRHFAEAGDWARAGQYLLKAGDRARQVYAYSEAIQFYEQALAILKDQGAFEEAARTLMRLGLLYHANYDFQRSRQAYQEGFALWKKAGGKLPAALPPAPHPLRISWPEILTLDSSMAFEAASVPVINQLFVGLVSLTPDLDVVPELAQSWEVLDNGKKYIFHLDPEATWTDETPVTAADFEFTWKRILNPELHSRNAMLLYDIHGAKDYHQKRQDPDAVGVRALDPHTLEVTLEQPTGYFLHLLTYAATFAVPRHVVEARGPDWVQTGQFVSNGPFCLDDWQPGNHLTLVRNPRYRGRFSGNLQRVEIFLRPEFNNFVVRMNAYEAGELDVCGLGGAPEESDRARQRHAGEYVSYPTANVSFLVFNTSQPPFDDLRVRRAFAHCLDREALAEVNMRGYPLPATGGLVPTWLPGHTHGSSLVYDPDQARRLLAEAGYPHGRGFPEIEIWLSRPEDPRVVEFVHDLWLEILGIQSHWEPMDSGILFSRLLKEMPHAFMNGWLADYPDPDSFLRVAVTYQTRWRDPNYFQLIEKARRMTSPEERTGMYQEAEQILAREVPIFPLFYGRSHLLVKPWMRRYSLSPIQPLIFKDVVIEPH